MTAHVERGTRRKRVWVSCEGLATEGPTAKREKTADLSPINMKKEEANWSTKKKKENRKIPIPSGGQ